ncbi:LPXTG cell wall anchor domain-containing protein [Streptomyces sp. ISL-66]|uniref:LPXTG cell wall anchor domain-containing protein n=1 Tax=Streptomyces sp. ISL-66 TaxID=2819186 RepID=UPI001BE9990F|nr:LPXTG cell wall anchor domain-containing protein [Streptomyces sp. ISL-66]MBT2467349.1 LPXTG cell wall anchor domain-containing protein [Streptomyces sp. ISL-66]
MSARTAALRNTSAAVVAAAIAGTVLMPLSAHAAGSEDGSTGLKTTMTAPVPSGPLTRGGAAQTFELTVANPTDKVSAYHPWAILDHTGNSPVQDGDVSFKVEAVNAPATTARIGHQDGGWQGMFYPTGPKEFEPFEIPAGGKLTWKITIGLGASYPTVNGDFTLAVPNYSHPSGDVPSLTFKTSPATKPGTLKAAFEQLGPCEVNGGDDCRMMALRYSVTGDGEFNSALGTWFSVDLPDEDRNKADLQARVRVDGQWKDVKVAHGEVNMPVIPKGFGAASGDRVTYVQLKLGPKSQIKKLTKAKATAQVHLTEGLVFSFVENSQQFSLGPAAPAPTTPAPTSPAPTKPVPATPAPTTPAPTGSTTTTPVASTTPIAANAPVATGSLAHTGSDSNTGLYTALAAALIALGGAAAWLGARRRKAVRG